MLIGIVFYPNAFLAHDLKNKFKVAKSQVNMVNIYCNQLSVYKTLLVARKSKKNVNVQKNKNKKTPQTNNKNKPKTKHLGYEIWMLKKEYI